MHRKSGNNATSIQIVVLLLLQERKGRTVVDCSILVYQLYCLLATDTGTGQGHVTWLRC